MQNLRTRLTLQPGQRGTKKLMKQHGDRLVCVRYRYDERTGKRIKTVELIVDETGWDRADPHIPSWELRYVLIEPHEVGLRKKIKAAGGRWHPDRVAWSLPHDRIVSLGIADRILDDPVRSEGPGTRASKRRSKYM